MDKFVLPDPDKVIAILRDVAAAEVLPRFGTLAEADISEKRPGEVVTAADLASEIALEGALTALLPGSRACGEEGSERDPSALDALRGDAPVWILDPVDGTANFARGDACFAMIVALAIGGETRAGWIHDPVKNTTVWAIQGKGAFENRARLRISAPAALPDMTGMAGKKARERIEARRAAGEKGLPQTVARYGCAGQEYIALARNQIHYSRYGGKLKPWDHAAGTLIHREAGGFAAHMRTAKPYAVGAGITEEFLLHAPDRARWDALHALIESR